MTVVDNGDGAVVVGVKLIEESDGFGVRIDGLGGRVFTGDMADGTEVIDVADVVDVIDVIDVAGVVDVARSLLEGLRDPMTGLFPGMEGF